MIHKRSRAWYDKWCWKFVESSCWRCEHIIINASLLKFIRVPALKESFNFPWKLQPRSKKIFLNFTHTIPKSQHFIIKIHIFSPLICQHEWPCCHAMTETFHYFFLVRQVSNFIQKKVFFHHRVGAFGNWKFVRLTFHNLPLLLEKSKAITTMAMTSITLFVNFIKMTLFKWQRWIKVWHNTM